MNEPSQCPDSSMLHRFVAWGLSETAAFEVRQHLRACAVCREAVRELELVSRSSISSAGSSISESTITVDVELARDRAAARDDGPRDEFPPSSEESVDLSFLVASRERNSLGRIDQYEVRGVIGEGGMGIVLEAFDPVLARTVAIKVMSSRLAASEAGRRRFLREGRAAAAINHPNVVTIHAVGMHADRPYLVMEYIDGQSLRERIRSEPKLAGPQIAQIGLQIAEGLAAAHARGLIHRDIKPGNIMLEDGFERVKITDFGLALAAMTLSELTSHDQLVGTPAYMSPEHIRGLQLDARSDLFSLGAVVYAMALGNSPFRGSHHAEVINKVLSYRPPPLHELDRTLAPELSRIASRLLEVDRDHRYASAGEVAIDLRALVAEFNARAQRSAEVMGPIVLPSEAPTVALRNRSKAAKRFLVGLAVLGILGALGTVAWRMKPGPPAEPGPGLPTLSSESTKPNRASAVLTVAQAGSAKFHTISEALDAVPGPKTTIRIEDDATYDSPITISDSVRLAGLTIESPLRATITATRGADAVVTVHDVASVTLKGFRALSSGNQFGLAISHNTPGLLIEALQFNKPVYQPGDPFHCHVWLSFGARGDVAAPIRFRACSFGAWPTGIVLQGNLGGPTMAIRVEGCRFESMLRQVELIGPVQHVEIIGNEFRDAENAIYLDNVSKGSGHIHVLKNRFLRARTWTNSTTSTAEARDVEIASNTIIGSGSVDVAADRLLELGRSGWQVHDNPIEPDPSAPMPAK